MTITPKARRAMHTDFLLTAAHTLRHFRRHGPMTDTELIEGYDGKIPQTDSGLRTRRSELVKKGLLVDTGRRELLDTGRSSKVWGLPPRK